MKRGDKKKNKGWEMKEEDKNPKKKEERGTKGTKKKKIRDTAETPEDTPTTEGRGGGERWEGGGGFSRS